MLLHQPSTRYRAFATHLAFSIVIFAVLSSIIYFYWYPDFLFTTDGGWQGVRLIAAVDLVMGPLLTLMIYKKGKKGLFFDLTLITIAQVACLYIGMWIVQNNKPIAIIYANGDFFTMTEKSFQFHNIDTSNIPLLQDKKPAWIYVSLPEDKDEKLKFIMSQLYLAGLHIRIENYQPFDKNIEKLSSDAKRKDDLEKANITTKHYPDDALFFPITTKYDSRHLVFDSKSKKLLGLL